MNLGQLWGVSGGYRADTDLGRFVELQGGDYHGMRWSLKVARRL